MTTAVKSVKKNYILNIIHQLMLVFIPLIVTPYVSRILGPDGIGKYSFAYTLISYFIIFVSLGFNVYGKREIAKCSDVKKQSAVFYEIVACRAIFVFFAIITNLVLVWCGIYGKYGFLIMLLICELVAVAFDITFFFHGKEEFGKLIIINLIFKILSTIGIFLLIKTPDHLGFYVLLNAGVSLGSNITMWLFLKNKLVKVQFKELKIFRHLKNAPVLFLPILAISLFNLIDKSLIGLITQNDAENGYYVQTEKIVRKCILLINCLSIVMLPRNTHEISQGNVEQVKENNYQAIHFVWLISLPLICVLIFTASNLVPWFLGAEFVPSILLLQVMAVAILFAGISTVIGEQYLLPNKKDRQYVIAILVGVAISLLVNIPLIYWLGALGATLTMVIAELIIMIVMLCIVRKEFALGRVFKSLLKPLFASVSMIMVIWPLSIFLEPSILNTSLIVLCGALTYVVVILILRDSLIINLLRNLKKQPQKQSDNNS